jgi:alkanesulfonate monooxygenase SsuD/methylene tetrahydromethanopterin reductase-like flavin-dependent oxidoreductase (luciferase family)
VTQAGVREPVQVATDAATLAILAPGRVRLGLGAGHTPQEWADQGLDRPSPSERAGRLAEFTEVTARLLAGETVTWSGRYLTLRQARLRDLPVPDGGVSLTVGGGHPDVLRCAARYADVVGLSGLGVTLADGHRHEVRPLADLHHQLALIQDTARRAGRSPVLEALVQQVTVTDDRAAALRQASERLAGTTPEELAGSPYVLIGSYEEMAGQLRRQARELGITSYVVREAAVAGLERVLALLRA